MKQYASLLVVAVAVATLGVLLWHKPANTPVPENQAAPTIGGSFTLTNQRGETVKDTDLANQWKLVYFGFLDCPDICHIALATMDAARRANQTPFVPVFITLDPNRDTVEAMAKHFASFDPSWVALTGPQAAINDIVSKYKVYSNVRPGPAANYQVDHSSFIYLINPAGQYAAHYPHDVSVEDLLATLKTLVHP